MPDSEMLKNSIVRSVAKFTPKSQFGAALVGVIFTALCGLGLSKLSTELLSLYGWTLFVGLPFFCGFMSVFIYSLSEERSWKTCLAVSNISILLLGLLITVFAVDGLICIIMAAPLAFIVALPGAALGRLTATKIRGKSDPLLSLAGIILLLPLLMGFESKLALKPPVSKVVTFVDIDASPQKVWNYVVAFPPIPEPNDLIFKLGIAYPKSATIKGAGVGAIRYCNFSTGPFVEPIRVWQPPYLLKFDVASVPSPMKEWSFYPDLQPPHLHNFMVSEAGQFRLIKLNSQTTRLEGTTWYYHRLWPSAYWRVVSDAIIHKIHRRVLDHIKQQAERN